jgi:hypothetical protein
MAILGKGPVPKKKNKNTMPTSKVGIDPKSGQTIAAPGYKMGLIRNQKDMKEPTKKYTMGEGPASASFTVKQGIIGPKPVTPGGKAAAAPAKKKGPSAVGKAIRNVKDAVTSSGGNKPFISTRQKKARSKRTGKSCY